MALICIYTHASVGTTTVAAAPTGVYQSLARESKAEEGEEEWAIAVGFAVARLQQDELDSFVEKPACLVSITNYRLNVPHLPVAVTYLIPRALFRLLRVLCRGCCKVKLMLQFLPR